MAQSDVVLARSHIFRRFSFSALETVTQVTAFASKQDDKDITLATAPGADPEGLPMTTLAQENTVATQLRPLVMLVAAFSLSVAALLVTTASLGASPINSTEIASAQ